MATIVPTFEVAEKIGRQLEIAALTVDELVREGTRLFGEPFRTMCEHSAIVVNGRSVNLLRGGKTPLRPSDRVHFIKPSAGG